MTEPLSATLQGLLDEREIEKLAIRYCRAVDRRDWTALRALYHDDATDDHGSLFQGQTADYIRWLPAMMTKMRSTWHQVSNHCIALRGDVAEGEVYVAAYHLKAGSDGQDVQIVTGGRYLDRYARRDGVWKFQHRQAIMDWNEVQSSLQRWPASGRELQQDPSWDFFEFLGKKPAPKA